MAEGKPPAWEVTGQIEKVDLGPNGTFVQGVAVTFRTADGSVGTVFVPVEQYTADRVRAAINARAAALAEVAALRG